LEQIVSATGGAPKMLSHIIRAMAAFGFIKEAGVNVYKANNMTHIIASEHFSGAMEHMYHFHGPVSHAFPEWLMEHNYQDIASNDDLAFHHAKKTPLAPFEWLKEQPGQMKSLSHAMAMHRDGFWGDSYPILDAISTFASTPDSTLLVDVGGGFGQQAVAFKNKMPGPHGKIVVQDIPETLENAPKIEGIEFSAHDFFTVQPIVGAKFYYLRHIIHDWTDEDCIRILKAIVPAMKPDSRIVIDEIVLPDEGTTWQAAYGEFMNKNCHRTLLTDVKWI
jgi:demethylsterigmatocystin 6-O-methyltransferase